MFETGSTYSFGSVKSTALRNTNTGVPEIKAVEAESRAREREHHHEEAATLQLSQKALDQVREANRAASTAAALGMNATAAAVATVDVAHSDGSSQLDTVEEVGQPAEVTGQAADVSIGGEARRLAMGSAAATDQQQRRETAQPTDERFENQTDTAQVEAQADPGVAADELGETRDAGRPAL